MKNGGRDTAQEQTILGNTCHKPQSLVKEKKIVSKEYFGTRGKLAVIGRASEKYHFRIPREKGEGKRRKSRKLREKRARVCELEIESSHYRLPILLLYVPTTRRNLPQK